MHRSFILSLLVLLSACAPIATPEKTPEQSPIIEPTPSLQIVETPTEISTQLESTLEGYNPLLDSGVIITHIPPLFAETEDSIELEFTIDCDELVDSWIGCQPEVTLFTAYGLESDFLPISLTEEIQESLEVWTIDLPVADPNGQALYYYLEIKDEKARIQSRYPLTGAIELIVDPTFITIDLSTDESPLREGELILQMPWGSGSGQVGLSATEGPVPIGPSAFDVAPDGRIAVLDEVNYRVLVFDPKTNETKTYPVELSGWGDIAFTNSDEIIILDLVGENGLPLLYRIDANDNQVNRLGPIFTNSSVDLSSGPMIVDPNLGRIVNPLNSSGTIKSEEEQLQDYASAELLAGWQNDYSSLFADTQKRLIFNVQSTTPLGAIGYFVKTNNGYIMIFEGEFLRILWITSEGQILDDCRIANQQEAPINHLGRFVISQNGNVFYLTTTPEGMEIRRIDVDNFIL